MIHCCLAFPLVSSFCSPIAPFPLILICENTINDRTRINQQNINDHVTLNTALPMLMIR